MHPVLTVLHLGPEPRALGSYGACLALAIMLSAALSLRACVNAGLDAGATIAALGAAVAGGLLGANAAFVAVSLTQGASLWHALTHPGLVFYGGALGAALSFAATARRLGLPPLHALDLAAPALPLGHALGRVGCFLGGCCYGAEAHLPWSVTYTHALAPASQLPVPRHPWPLYEAGLSLVLALLLRSFPRAARGRRDGARFAIYVAAYGCIRFALEPLRGDAVRGVFLDGLLSTSQLWALCSVVAAVVFAASRVLPLRAYAALAAVLGFTIAFGTRPAAADRNEHLSLTVPARIRIAAGVFTMGSGDADVASALRLCAAPSPADACNAHLFADERPAHDVRLGAFLIDRTEVSRGGYARCVAAAACAALEPAAVDTAAGGDDAPVALVTWQEAARYCRFAGGGRLPSEAEWERAARGGSARVFPWGSVWNPKLANGGAAQAHPVSVESFYDGHSLYGALQMAGNVWEWVNDSYSGPYRVASANAPTDERVIRGGSFLSPAYMLRATFRGHMAAEQRRLDVGFRCAYDAR